MKTPTQRSLPTPLTQIPLDASGEELLRGRAADIERLVVNCQLNRLTLIAAVPGIGLTSLLRAGVVPALQRAGFLAVYFSDWQGRYFAAKLRETIAAIVSEQTGSHFSAEAEPLPDLLAKAHARTGKPIAIVLDQFEDYLRCHAGADISDYFDADLANAVCTRNTSFIIGIHEHVVPDLERMSPTVPNLLGHSIELSGVPTEAAKDIVRDVARQNGSEFDKTEVNRLAGLSEVQAADGVHPYFLKVAVGSPESGVFYSLDPFIEKFREGDAKLLDRWIPLFFSPDGPRQAATEKTLVAQAGRLAHYVPALLVLFVKAGFLRTLEMPGGARYELARESLAVILQDWWTRRKVTLAAQHRALSRAKWIAVVVGAIATIVFVYLMMNWRR